MLLETLSKALPMAIAVSVSPVPVAVALMIMLTRRARSNAPMFALGWSGGMVLICLLMIWMPGLELPDGESAGLPLWLRFLLGGLLLLLALRQWRRRPRPGDEVKTPALIARVDDFSMRHSLAIGLLLILVNMKNTPLVAAGALIISTGPLGTGEQALALMAFVLIASASVVGPVCAHRVLHEAIEPRFDRWKRWLIRNNAMIATVIIALVGVLLIGSGTRGYLDQRDVALPSLPPVKVEASFPTW